MLGMLYRDQSRFDEAASHLADSLERRVRLLGEGHPVVATTRERLEEVLAR
jgi:hypothetical protein